MGLFPVLFAAAGLTIEKTGILAAMYPAVWGAAQLATGAPSDKYGRKWLIVGGMLLQAAALAMIAVGHDFGIWLARFVLIADAYGIPAAVGVVAGLTALSGILVAVRMRSTDHHPATA